MIFLTALSILFLSSCQEDNVLPGEDDFFYGASLNVDNATTEIPVGVITSNLFSADFVLLAPQNGATVNKIDVSVVFKDLVNDGTDLSKESTFIESIVASAFIIGSETSRPEFSYAVPLQEILTTLSLNISDIDGSDEFDVIFSIAYDDHVIPISYNVIVVCPPTTSPTPGTWEIELREQFGDSWDGGALVITIDGTSTEYNSNQSLEIVTFNVPVGTVSLTVGYKGGNYDNENGWKITSANGKVVADVSIGDISGVSSGEVQEQTVDYCAY